MSSSRNLDANSCIIRTYTECVCKPFIINTYETKDLKLPRMNTYRKTRGREPKSPASLGESGKKTWALAR